MALFADLSIIFIVGAALFIMFIVALADPKYGSEAYNSRLNCDTHKEFVVRQYVYKLFNEDRAFLYKEYGPIDYNDISRLKEAGFSPISGLSDEERMATKEYKRAFYAWREAINVKPCTEESYAKAEEAAKIMNSALNKVKAMEKERVKEILSQQNLSYDEKADMISRDLLMYYAK